VALSFIFLPIEETPTARRQALEAREGPTIAIIPPRQPLAVGRIHYFVLGPTLIILFPRVRFQKKKSQKIKVRVELSEGCIVLVLKGCFQNETP